MVSVRLVACLVLLMANAAHAATYYVSTTGNNSSDGLTESTPWRTIGKATSTMVEGDTTYVRGGTYDTETTVRFNRTGTSSAPIKLLNYPGESPVLDWVDQGASDTLLIQHASGINVAIGYITIEGFEIKNGHDGLKFYSMHNSVIQKNWIHDNKNQGIVSGGGHSNLFDRNIINHNGNFVGCAASAASCNQTHGMYLHGQSYTITHNIIYDNLGYGIQQNGSPTSTYAAAKHPSPDFAGAANWIISDNTFGYQSYRAGMVVWGGLCTNARIENNIFYENAVNSGSLPQGVAFTGATCTGVQIKNNHFYASGSGGTTGIGSGAPGDLVNSGNVTNVSAPAFVDAAATMPGSPDFRLTASAPVNIALANEVPNNSTLVVGAFKTVATPACTLTANVITCIFPMSTAVPIQNLSAAGVTIGCTGANCPGGGLTASAVSRVTATDTHGGITVAGFTANACVATNQAVTLSYTSATGSWTGNDHIGPYSGLHQKILSFTNLAVTNNCTGSGPTGYPAGYHLFYKFDENTSTNANDESANNLDGTLTNSPTWGAGKTGYGVVTTGNNTEHVAIPYGSGVNPSSQSLTIAFGVNIPSGNQSLARQYFGAPLGTNQRLYVSTSGGTWRLGIQSSNDGTASELAVASGWNHVCLTMNSATDTATLHIDGVASTSAGAVKTYTSYALAGDFDLGRIADVATGGGGGTYDDPIIYTSVEDCGAIYTAFQATPTAPGGTLAQAAVQFQGVTLDATGNVITFGALNSTQEVVKRGGGAVVFQVHCQAGAACDETAFKLVYAKNQTATAARAAGTYITAPNTETSDGFWFWGTTTETLNSGITTTRLTGSCTVTNGTTQLTTDQVPSVGLSSDGCIVLRYIFRVGDGVGDYFEPFLVTQSGLVLTGGYVDGRITVVNPRASGIGF